MGLRDIIGKDTWLRTTYRWTKQYYYDQRERPFLRANLDDVYHIHYNYASPPILLLITVAYNRADMIRHQLRLLPKYLSDPFAHIVVDNSSNKQARKEIASVCRSQGIGYVSLPKNFYTHSSSSHGLTLNWAYQHLVRRINPLYVGFLDHDIFPVRKHSILDKLARQPAYGQKDVRERISYLWPGFSFYRTELLEGRQIDFKPGVIEDIIVDTGGLIPIKTLRSGDKTSWVFAEGYYSNIAEGNIPSAHMIEWLKIDGQDTWLHCISAGHKLFAGHKEEVLCKLLASYER